MVKEEAWTVEHDDPLVKNLIATLLEGQREIRRRFLNEPEIFKHPLYEGYEIDLYNMCYAFIDGIEAVFDVNPSDAVESPRNKEELRRRSDPVLSDNSKAKVNDAADG